MKSLWTRSFGNVPAAREQYLTTSEKSPPQPAAVGVGRKFRLHSDCELPTVNFHKAPTSRIPAMSLAHMAGGGILPSSRQHHRHLVLGFRVPAVKLVVHAANWRGSPVFPPAISAETLPQPPMLLFFFTALL